MSSLRRNKENVESTSKNSDKIIFVSETETNYIKNLSLIVSGIGKKKKNYSDYCDFEEKIAKISNKINFESELDYRCNLMNINNNKSLYEKMLSTGKIFTKNPQTILEIDNKEFSNDTNFVENLTFFRANNALIVGKWFYEVQLFSNDSISIGWCQYKTNFFRKNYLGDDETSYGYDGYNKRKLNKCGNYIYEKYGFKWDIGDIIGVCIDLELGKIEYFQNGKSLGVAFQNIKIGSNLYFPAVSLSKFQRIIFNFGGSEFKYNYPGYDPIDIPPAIYSGMKDSTNEFIIMMNNFVFEINKSDQITEDSKFNISSNILNYLFSKSLKDEYIIKTIILPFLCQLSDENLNYFIKAATSFFKDKININIQKLISILIKEIESNGVIPDNFEKWESYVKLFLKLLKEENIVKIWLSNNSYKNDIFSLFSFDNIKIRDILSDNALSNIIANRLNNFNEILIPIINKLRNERFKDTDKRRIDLFCEFFEIILFDKREYTIYNEKIKLKNIFIEEIIENSIKKSRSIRTHIIHSFLYDNFYFNLMELLNRSFNEKNFHNFNFGKFIHRNSRKNIYYENKNIGGNIANVTKLFSHNLKPCYIKEDDNELSYLLHNLLNFSINHVNDVIHNFVLVKDKLNSYNAFPQGMDKSFTDNIVLYKNVEYLMKMNNLQLLYNFSYNLLLWIKYIQSINNDLLYFIPLKISIFPYQVYQLIQSMNDLSEAYLKEMIYFYVNLCNDDKIIDIEYKSDIISIIKCFINKPMFIQLINSDKTLQCKLIESILKNFCHEYYFMSCVNLILTFVKPKAKSESEADIIKIDRKYLNILIFNYFENNNSYNKFMQNFNKMLNDVMTKFITSLTDSINRINNNNFYERSLDVDYLCKLMYEKFDLLTKLVIIYEFIIDIMHKQFLDTTSTCFIRLLNFLTNISSRILVHSDKFINIMKRTMAKKIKNLMSNFCCSIMSIILNLNEYNQKTNNNKFLTKFIIESDLDMIPLECVINYVNDKGLINRYNLIIENYKSFKKPKINEIISNSEYKARVNKENLCIICYSDDINALLLPCKHGGCELCIKQYLSEKNKCFICNQKVEGYKFI